jgi:hypothetical protein
VISDLERDILLEEMSWRQKSRLTNAQICFHSVANMSRRNNFIALLVNGLVTFDHTKMRSRTTLCIFMKDCLLHSLVGDPSWLALHLITLMKRPLG